MHKKLWFFLLIVFALMFIIHSTISEKSTKKRFINKLRCIHDLFLQKQKLKRLLKELLRSDNEEIDNKMKNKKKFWHKLFAQKSEDEKYLDEIFAQNMKRCSLWSNNEESKIINLSNAPPCNIGEESEGSGRWQISQGSGGLVTCVEPVLATTNECRNVWIFSKKEPEKLKKANSLKKSMEREDSLKKYLSSDCEDRGYKMNPVFVSENDYKAFYEDISNGLLWPGLHNMPNYIREDYKSEENGHLRTHEAFAAYVRVNFKFAVEALRQKSNRRDFIWVHDYHLMLVGLAIREMAGGGDTVETGFFLHIPFQPPAIAKYPRIARAIFRGMLAFSKIGFQTHRDRDKFVEMVRKYFEKIEIFPESGFDDVILIQYDGWTCALGVFPVTIKNEDFLELANDEEVKAEAMEIRKKIFYGNADSENDEIASKKSENSSEKSENASKKCEITPKKSEKASEKGEIASKKCEITPKKSEKASEKGEIASKKCENASEKGEIASKKCENASEKGENSSEYDEITSEKGEIASENVENADSKNDDFRLFFSAERFDYTKGIRSKLTAFGTYLRNHPERRGKDVLFQLAVINRREVASYRSYQDECEKIKNNINAEFKDAEKYPNWKPIIFKTEKFDRRKLIAHYLAMDVGVVTPRMDGMNLVSKEMLLCNPKAALILSVGAGSDYQFQKAGLYNEEDPNYFRVNNIHDPDEFPEIFHQAALQSRADRLRHGMVLNKFIRENNIERWSQAFLDSEWSPLNLLKKLKPKKEKFKTNNEILSHIYG